MSTENIKQISIKIQFQEEVRRFRIALNITYKELCDILNKIFSIDVKNRDLYSLFYYDDENEPVVFSSDLELQEAFRFIEETETTLFKLFVTEKKNNRKKKKISKKIEKNQQVEIEEEEKDQNFSQFFNNFFGQQQQQQQNPLLFVQNILNNPNKLMMIFQHASELFQQIKDDIVVLSKNQKVTNWLKSVHERLLSGVFELIKNGENQLELFLIQVDSLLEISDLSKEIQQKIKKVAEIISNKMIQIKDLIGENLLLPLLNMLSQGSNSPNIFNNLQSLVGGFQNNMQNQSQCNNNPLFSFLQNFGQQQQSQQQDNNLNEKKKQQQLEETTFTGKERLLGKKNNDQKENKMEMEKEQEQEQNKTGNESVESLYQEELTQLSQIGLFDRETNLFYLKKYNGDVKKTANAILSRIEN
ncbi:sequestosome-1 [Anaeramoeba flamelloides]|uniref:Sequestosome-1 n=1 Tax=Anaeramoeba flamelloides TaxID=1746091 RepID=A0AAV8A9X7_9EUKA|nr:sequestosome-1 [Anaeramoeba flamelloides]